LPPVRGPARRWRGQRFAFRGIAQGEVISIKPSWEWMVGWFHRSDCKRSGLSAGCRPASGARRPKERRAWRRRADGRSVAGAPATGPKAGRRRSRAHSRSSLLLRSASSVPFLSAESRCRPGCMKERSLACRTAEMAHLGPMCSIAGRGQGRLHGASHSREAMLKSAAKPDHREHHKCQQQREFQQVLTLVVPEEAPHFNRHWHFDFLACQPRPSSSE